MNAPTSVSFRNLSAVIQGLASASGASIPKVIDSETGKILEKCISLTPSASVAKIRSNVENREWGLHKIDYTPKGTFKGKTIKGRKRYKYSNKYPAAVWNAIAEQRKKSLQKKLASRGLAKQSWAKLAEIAGLEIKVAKRISNLAANYSKNFDVRRVSNEGAYSINFRNAQPTINFIGGKSILRRAINGRVKYFQTNLKKGVLDDMATFAKAYPGIVKVSPIGGYVV